LNFQDAQQRLLAYVRDRIHNGELTERRFARMLGVSQPHAHNVLKGVRKLSVEISDSILRVLQISLLDIATIAELERNIKQRSGLGSISRIRFLGGAVGPGLHWPSAIDAERIFRYNTSDLPASESMIAAQLAPDPRMAATIEQAEIAILDTSERKRTSPSPEGLYVVERASDVVLRRVRPGARGYYLIADDALESPALWELIVPPGGVLSLVKAQVAWLGQESDPGISLAQRGRFFAEVISS